MLTLLDMPEDVWRQIALHLEAPEVLHFLSSHRRIHNRLGKNSSVLWKYLYRRDCDCDHHLQHHHCHTDSEDGDEDDNATSTMPSYFRKEYMIQAYQRHLPAIEMISLQSTPSHNPISAREGHIACVFETPLEQRICVSGGFVDDRQVHVLRVPKEPPAQAHSLPPSSRMAQNPMPTSLSPATHECGKFRSLLSSMSLGSLLRPNLQPPPRPSQPKIMSPTWTWNSLTPKGPTTLLYGSSLSALDETRAVRFGGFRSGGYTGETNQVSLLTVRTKNGRHNDGHTGTSTFPSRSNNTDTMEVDDEEESDKPDDVLEATWETITTHNPQFGVARAYHSATLVGNRYLVVLGGMARRDSILSEAILDTATWTWIDPTRITELAPTTHNCKPSGRHGHSVVLDSRRNRLVLFGGGSGSDLLRSGEDNAEVWELKMGHGWETDLENSFPWTWSKKHADPWLVNDGGDAAGMAAQEIGHQVYQRQPEPADPILSVSEALCLGRCHQSVKVSPDMALLVFGSGKPSTNGVIAYSLRDDSFVRPQVIGPLPRPRFTFVSALLQQQGYLFIHGGYASQESDTTADMTILDLAPFVPNRKFTGLPIDEGAEAFRKVDDYDADRIRLSHVDFTSLIMGGLGILDESERRAILRHVMVHGHLGF